MMKQTHEDVAMIELFAVKDCTPIPIATGKKRRTSGH